MSRTQELTHNLVKTDEIIGVNVINTQDEDLGEIKELVIDKLSGHVVYAVLSFGGFLGLGDKYFALPWKALNYDLNKDAFILNVSKEQLKNAPGFDKDHWPDMSDRTWESRIYKFYSIKPYWEK